MARKTPVPARERQICKRLREIRLSTKLSQVAAARELEIDSALLASYEHGRIPLRYDFAESFCAIFNVSQRWLAEGIGLKRYYIFTRSMLTERIAKNALFSDVYYDCLKPLLDDEFKKIGDFTGSKFDVASLNEYVELCGPSSVGAIAPEDLANIFARRLLAEAKLLPPHLYNDLFRTLSQSLRGFTKRYEDWMNRFQQITSPDGRQNEDLTHSSLKSIYTGVRSEQLPMLLKRLNAVTAQRGERAALAKLLNVPAARVSEWLSGKKEPGGESTLQLLAWVTAEEAKQKSPGGAINTTRAQTRKRKSDEEKPDSSPPKP